MRNLTGQILILRESIMDMEVSACKQLTDGEVEDEINNDQMCDGWKINPEYTRETCAKHGSMRRVFILEADL